MFFNEEEFINKLDLIRTKDDYTTALKLAVVVIGGNIGSSLDIYEMIQKLYGEPLDTVCEKNPDISIIIELDLLTEEIKKYDLSPTFKLVNRKGEKIKKTVTVTEQLKKLHKIDKENYIRLVYNPNSRKSKQKKQKGMDAFYNSLKIEFMANKSNISGKIFPNGKLHITGSKTIRSANNSPVIIYDFIKKYCYDSVVDKDNFCIKDVEISMINTNFKFNKMVNRDNLNRIINENNLLNGGDWRKSTFQPNLYPGVNAQFWSQSAKDKYLHILTNENGGQLENKKGSTKRIKIVPKKIDGQTAIFIFRPGSVIITGAKSIDQLSDAYNSIVKLVRNHEYEVLYDENDSSDSDDSDDTDSSDDEFNEEFYEMIKQKGNKNIKKV